MPTKMTANYFFLVVSAGSTRRWGPISMFNLFKKIMKRFQARAIIVWSTEFEARVIGPQTEARKATVIGHWCKSRSRQLIGSRVSVGQELIGRFIYQPEVIKGQRAETQGRDFYIASIFLGSEGEIFFQRQFFFSRVSKADA